MDVNIGTLCMKWTSGGQIFGFDTLRPIIIDWIVLIIEVLNESLWETRRVVSLFPPNVFWKWFRLSGGDTQPLRGFVLDLNIKGLDEFKNELGESVEDSLMCC